MTDNKVLQVSDSVSWIGVLDPGLVTFDVVMETRFGTTYNSFFINAEKKTVVETVKAKFRDTWLAKIRQLTDPSEIEYIILNHTEPDHSGNLAEILKLAPNAKVVGTGNAIRYLTDQMGFKFPNLIVKDGHTLDLGNMQLRFIGAPNLHWPDTMYTWLETEKVLFTCDSFGEHFCRGEMFDDLTEDFGDPFRYYFDVIMKPYSRFMLQAIERIRPLDISVICPGHGVILRSYWKKYVGLTEQYAREAMKFPEKNRVFIAFVSAYQNTGIIAEMIARGIREAGDLEVSLLDIEKFDLAGIEEELTRASGVILGSPTFNQNILMPVYQVFSLINPIRDRGKLAAAFGSYGWSPEAAKIINANFTNLKMDVFDEGLMVRFTPHNETAGKCVEYGRKFGARLLEKINEKK
jgi:NADH oxidase (H2O-forming)